MPRKIFVTDNRSMSETSSIKCPMVTYQCRSRWEPEEVRFLEWQNQVQGACWRGRAKGGCRFPARFPSRRRKGAWTSLLYPRERGWMRKEMYRLPSLQGSRWWGVLFVWLWAEMNASSPVHWDLSLGLWCVLSVAMGGVRSWQSSVT